MTIKVPVKTPKYIVINYEDNASTNIYTDQELQEFLDDISDDWYASSDDVEVRRYSDGSRVDFTFEESKSAYAKIRF